MWRMITSIATTDTAVAIDSTGYGGVVVLEGIMHTVTINIAIHYIVTSTGSSSIGTAIVTVGFDGVQTIVVTFT